MAKNSEDKQAKKTAQEAPAAGAQASSDAPIEGDTAQAQEETPTKQNGSPEEPTVEKITHVTRLQWAAILFLGTAILLIYIVWPVFLASDRKALKSAGHYIEKAEKSFDKALQEGSFPKKARTRTYLDVAWNFEAAQRAGWEMRAEDNFRWGFTLYYLAMLRAEGSPHAFIQPTRMFNGTLKTLARAKAEGKLDARLPSEEKVRYLLGLSYLGAGKPSAAVVHFEILRKSKQDYESSLRHRDRDQDDGKVRKFGIDPYSLQLGELLEADHLLGKAYYMMEDRERAAEALQQYWESTRGPAFQRRMEAEVIEPNYGLRFQALSLLGKIYWEMARRHFVGIKKGRAMQAPPDVMEKNTLEWKQDLADAARYLGEALKPEFKVFRLAEVKLQLAEISFHQKDHDRVLKLADDFEQEEQRELRSLKEAMTLWKVLSLLALGRSEGVEATLASIAGAGEEVDDQVKLAALVILGDAQVAKGQDDLPLGDLVGYSSPSGSPRQVGAYHRVARHYPEELFDENPFIDKMTLISHALRKAREAREKSDEDKAVVLYSFLLERFSIPQSGTMREIAFLRRARGREMLREDGLLSPRAKESFRQSAEYYVLAATKAGSVDERNDACFESAESYFDGHFYAKAYDAYGLFIELQEPEEWIPKARHKRGISALHRKTETRFKDAIAEFVANISRAVRSVDDNASVPTDQKYAGPTEAVMVDRILADVNTASRDIWAYNSYLALGDAFYGQHKYELGRKVYTAIMNDPRFTPEAEVWRKAAYQLGRLRFDETCESKKDIKPWNELIPYLDQLLVRYDYSLMSSLYKEDRELLAETRAANAEIKFLLAKSYLENGDAEQAAQECRDLISRTEAFSLDKDGVRRADALYGDALYGLRQYAEAYEQYRRAHDRHLESYERPFYSLRMSDCKAGLGRKDDAVSLLKRTKWEFEKVFDENGEALKHKGGNLDRAYWLRFVDRKISHLETAAAGG